MSLLEVSPPLPVAPFWTWGSLNFWPNKKDSRNSLIKSKEDKCCSSKVHASSEDQGPLWDEIILVESWLQTRLPSFLHIQGGKIFQLQLRSTVFPPHISLRITVSKTPSTLNYLQILFDDWQFHGFSRDFMPVFKTSSPVLRESVVLGRWTGRRGSRAGTDM